MIFRSVDLPQPIVPRIDTNSPRSTDSDTSYRTSRDKPLEVTNALVTPATSMKAMRQVWS